MVGGMWGQWVIFHILIIYGDKKAREYFMFDTAADCMPHYTYAKKLSKFFKEKVVRFYDKNSGKKWLIGHTSVGPYHEKNSSVSRFNFRKY